MRPAAVEIERGTATEVERLRPLWLLMHHHHQDVLPGLAPYVDDERSWAVRADFYRKLLAKPDSTLLLAYLADALVGYAFAHVTRTERTWVADTWQAGERIGEIESLSVVPQLRGQGVGTALLATLITTLTDLGVDDLVIGVVAGNRAQHLYERFGFQTTWSYLTRFNGRQ